jgi:hypothetical protein
VAKKIKPRPGDVFEIELAPGYKGYGRMLVVEKGYYGLFEFYQVNPSKPYSLEQLKENPKIYATWGSYAMISTGEWPIVGRIPIPADYEYPTFYTEHPVKRRIYVIYPFNREGFQVSREELNELIRLGKVHEGGHPGFSAGYEYIRQRYARLMQEKDLLPRDLQNPADSEPEFIQVDIFDIDLAADIRTDFEARISKGKSVEDATRLVLKKYREALEDEDDEATLYLALAALQLEQGELQEEVKARALQVIDSGQDLARWEDAKPEVYEARKQVLHNLKNQLIQT